jgi:hypothetical protein
MKKQSKVTEPQGKADGKPNGEAGPNTDDIQAILKQAKDRATWHCGLLDGYAPRLAWHSQKPSTAQMEILQRRGFKPPDTLTKGEAWHLIKGPSPKQKRFLEERDLWQPTLTFDEALKIIGLIAKQENWANSNDNNSNNDIHF